MARIRFTGALGQVLISSEDGYRVLHVHAQGAIPSSSSVSVTYPVPIKTQSPPLVLATRNGVGYWIAFAHTGGPGNWTGFTASSADMGLGTIVEGGTYKTCCIDPPNDLGSGFKMRSRSTGVCTFNSNYQVFSFLGGSQTWNYISTGRVGVTYYHHFSRSWTPSNNYFLISHVAREFVYWSESNGVVNQNRSTMLGIGHRETDLGNVYLSIASISQDRPRELGIPLMWGR